MWVKMCLLGGPRLSGQIVPVRWSSVVGLTCTCMVGVLRVVGYALPRFLCSPAVVLLPGVNLYPFFSSLLSPSLAFCCGCARACGGSVHGRSLPLWCGRSCICLAAGSVRARFCPCLCRSFFVILVCLGYSRVFGLPGCVFVLLFLLSYSVGSVFLCLFSLSFGPVLRFRGVPWALGESHIDVFTS